MFNVKIKKFRDVEQVQIFSSAVFEKGEFDYRKVVPSTGEICPQNRQVLKIPFEEDYVIGFDFHDKDDINLRRSYRRTKNSIYDIARANEWDYFVTFTFNPDKVDSFDYDVTTSKLSQWLKNMRKKSSNLKYLVVPEQHISGRWHFHGLFYSCENLDLSDSGLKDSKGRTIFNVGRYHLGWSTATRIEHLEQACNYITKYTTKELMSVTYNKKRYWSSRNVCLPILETYMVDVDSKGFEELQRIKELSEDEGYQKKISSLYAELMILELPIYTTNTNFSKRCGQIPCILL